MSDPYIGEIRMFGGMFAPVNWRLCDGSIVAISQYDALYNLIGTIYGGDGQQTFALPDLRGRLPIHQSPSYPLGAIAGTENVTLNVQQLPAHNHPFVASTAAARTGAPSGSVVAQSPTMNAFFSGRVGAAMSTTSIGPYGGSGQHSNIQPFQCVTFIIAMFGVYPSQN